MNLHHYYWFFDSIISKDECQRIIQAGDKSFKKAKIQNKSELKKTRNSKVCFLDSKKHDYAFDIVRKYSHLANRNAGWNFHTDWVESLQLTRYTKNQFYDWHRDAADVPYSFDHPDPEFRGKSRKISMTLNLTDPFFYEGGDLEFNFQHKLKDKPQVCKVAKPQGTIIFFPSFVHHRVTPVTKGTRWSLVAWILGKPWS